MEISILLLGIDIAVEGLRMCEKKGQEGVETRNLLGESRVGVSMRRTSNCRSDLISETPQRATPTLRA